MRGGGKGGSALSITMVTVCQLIRGFGMTMFSCRSNLVMSCYNMRPLIKALVSLLLRFQTNTKLQGRARRRSSCVRLISAQTGLQRVNHHLFYAVFMCSMVVKHPVVVHHRANATHVCLAPAPHLFVFLVPLTKAPRIQQLWNESGGSPTDVP